MSAIDSLAALLAAGDQPPRQLFGVTMAVVTNNQDPDGLGRVKVRFPWLSDRNESHWARLVAPMAGAEYGLYCLPEVGDEVLVAFEHGRADFAYVLGALWNGKAKPPEKNDDGKNNRRVWKSRSGHRIVLDDAEGKEKIEIRDAKDQLQLIFDTAEKSVTLSAEGDVTLESKTGSLRLKAKTAVEIASEGEVKVEAKKKMALDAGPGLDVKAKGQVNVKGQPINLN